MRNQLAQLFSRRIVTSQTSSQLRRKITAGTVIAAANPTPAASGVRSYFLRRAVPLLPDMTFLRRFSAVKGNIGGISEGKAIGVEASVDGECGKSEEEEMRGESVRVRYKCVSNGGESDEKMRGDDVRGESEEEMRGDFVESVDSSVKLGNDIGANGSMIGGSNKDNIVKIASKLSLAISFRHVSLTVLYNYFFHIFQMIIQWVQTLDTLASGFITVFVGLFGTIWDLGMGLEYARDMFRDWLGGGRFIHRIMLPDGGIEFRISRLNGAKDITVQVVDNTILRVRATVRGKVKSYNLVLPEGMFKKGNHLAVFYPDSDLLTIELTKYQHDVVHIPVRYAV